MLIRVRYPDGLTRMVHPALLHQLIRPQKIRAFRRADGWIKLGVDPPATVGFRITPARNGGKSPVSISTKSNRRRALERGSSQHAGQD